MKPSLSMYATLGDFKKALARQYINVNVWDGENRSGAKNDKASFSPDELQELVDGLVDYLERGGIRRPNNTAQGEE